MNTIRILGLDPGLRITGFGLIEKSGSKLHYVTSGCIKTTLTALPDRLKTILNGVREVIEANQPGQVAVEKVFVNVNPQSTLLLGQARGAALSALVAHDLSVAEYTALQMKRAVVGHGQAKKEQVQQMVMRLLGLPSPPGPDAADALGLAICHAHAAGSFAAIEKAAVLAPRAHARFKRGRSY